MNPTADDPYTLLNLFLSPWKDEQALVELRGRIGRGEIEWEPLVFLANIHYCTPLWYVRLGQDGLLEDLPAELREYLENLCQINRERNERFVSELELLLDRFGRQEIEVVLLKGAAVFSDDLYGDIGARVMQDLDLLIRKDDSVAALRVLSEAGYVEIRDPGMELEGLPTDSRHHHLHPHIKPGTQFKIELHYKVTKGQAQDLFPIDLIWQNTEEIELGGKRARLLNPTWRLLHNTTHALLPDAEFIRGDISLRQLVEFSYLAQRYAREISWPTWQKKGEENGLGLEFATYLLLAQRLVRGPFIPGISSHYRAERHGARIVAAGKNMVVARFPDQGPGRLSSFFTRTALRIYYLLNLPAWVWRNVCYTEGSGNTLGRAWYFLKKSTSRRSRAKI